MEKEDLKTGMLVQFRNGNIYMVINDYFININGWMPTKKYKGNLTFNGNSEYDIIKVSDMLIQHDLKPEYWTEETINNNILWYRKKEIPELTMQEAIDKIGFEFKIKR